MAHAQLEPVPAPRSEPTALDQPEQPDQLDVARAAASARSEARLSDVEARRGPRPARLAGLVDDYLQDQYCAIGEEAAALRQGENRVHRLRVAIRRTRSTVRVFADLFDPDSAAALDSELSWLAEMLGRARDLDVVRERLEARVADLPADLLLGPVAADVASVLGHDRAAAGAAIETAMRGRRYLGLLTLLEAWRQQLPRSDRDPKAAKVAAYVDRAGRRAANRLQSAIETADDADFHRARKAAKRHRYAAELATPRLGGKAAQTVAGAVQLQDDLGGLQDTAAARAVLLDLGRRVGAEAGRNGFAFGLMYAQERQAADEIRQRIAARDQENPRRASGSMSSRSS